MNTQTRRTLLTSLVTIAAMYFAVGLVGQLLHKLDLASTLILIDSFAVFSVVITWRELWDDRRTRERLVRSAAQLAPYHLDISVCKGGVYEIVSRGALFEEIVSEALDLDELEAFTDGLRHGVVLAKAGHDDGAMEARIAAQEVQYVEDQAHIGIDGSYIWRIPGMED